MLQYYIDLCTNFLTSADTVPDKSENTLGTSTVATVVKYYIATAKIPPEDVRVEEIHLQKLPAITPPSQQWQRKEKPPSAPNDNPDQNAKMNPPSRNTSGVIPLV